MCAAEYASQQSLPSLVVHHHCDAETVFRYAPEVVATFTTLRTRVWQVSGITAAPVVVEVAELVAAADARLALGVESEFAEIQAWRKAFALMGLKPTQYRCAAEALLRRYRKEKQLPRCHPAVALCNAVSLSCATPIAVFDRAALDGVLEVRPARGDERYVSFSGGVETPEKGEIIFVDTHNTVHARRWCHRQSAQSAVRESSSELLIVAEALHANAESDLVGLEVSLLNALQRAWPRCMITRVLPR